MNTESRRRFLQAAGVSALGAPFLWSDRVMAQVSRFRLLAGDKHAEAVADDEKAWSEVRAAFEPCDPWINLNCGGASPSTRAVFDRQLAARRRLLKAPAFVFENEHRPQIESTRHLLAGLLDVPANSVALTRNTTESLSHVIFGLNLSPGDEVLVTSQNYPRMINGWKQRAERHGLVVRVVELPLGDAAASRRVETIRRAISARTRVLEILHVGFLDGAIWPVEELCRLAREAGVFVIVDGAHGLAHVPFKVSDFGCDVYASSLHKWLGAPMGGGVLHVAPQHIKDIWPLFPAPSEYQSDIRKFEEIGTYAADHFGAVAEAIRFHLELGPEKKAARLRYLNHLWMNEVIGRKGARRLTPATQGSSCGIELVQFPGVDHRRWMNELRQRWGILTQIIRSGDVEGLRVSPHVGTSRAEIEKFTAVILKLQDEDS